ncbi:MAG TPA: ISAs1 family transposase [Gemmata sp.]
MPLPLATVFADVPGPRRETANKLHKLVGILVLATCAVSGGADGWEEMAEYGRAKEAFFRRFLELPNGLPSHDTFERVFIKLDPDAFADRFGRWMKAACESTGLAHVAVDGTSARSSAQGTFTGCLHLVNAWAVENRLILGARSVPEGGHEITTIPDLLAALDLAGAVVTIDAAGCQTEIVQQIRAQGGDYLVTVKGNQPKLHEAIRKAFEESGEKGFAGRQDGVNGGRWSRSPRRALCERVAEPARVAGRLGGCGRGGDGWSRTVCEWHEHEFGPLLPDELEMWSPEVSRLHPWSLGHRERVARVSGCVVPRGRKPNGIGSCGGKLGHAASGGVVAAQADGNQRKYPNSTDESRLG